jgi:hypothetical protein
MPVDPTAPRPPDRRSRSARLRRLLLPGVVSAGVVTACTVAPLGPDGFNPGGDGAALPVCAAATLAAVGSAADATEVTVPLPPASLTGPVAVLGARAVRLSAVDDPATDPRGASVVLAVEGPFELLDANGAVLPANASVASSALPTTVYVRATGWGAGEVIVRPDPDADLGCVEDRLALRAVAPPDLAGRKLAQRPFFDPTDTLRSDDQLDVQLALLLHPDRAGLSGDVYVVRHRTPTAWWSDRTLVDVTGGAEPLTLDTATPAREAAVRAWRDLAAPSGQPTPSDSTADAPYAGGYDVVLDLDRDGTLSDGDLIDGLGQRPGFWVTPNLAAPGPYTPEMHRQDGGGWLQQEIWYPAEIASLDAPAPLVVISHGNGHDYRWYDHIGAHLSSWGFVVMSHANNTAPGIETASQTTLRNTEYFVLQHGGWFGGALNGRVDPHRIAWVGHSRGGEGVVRARQKMASGAATPAGYTLADLQTVVSIAPTVFLGVARSNPGDTPYQMLYGSSDGDVNGGADCDLCQAMRLASAATGPVGVTYLHGASHNAFHNGDGLQDGQGPDQLPRDQVHAIELATLLAHLGWRMQGVSAYKAWMLANPDGYRAQGWPDDAVVATTWRDAPDAGFRFVDAFQLQPDPAVNDLGGAVVATVTDVVEALMDDSNADFSWLANGRDPMNGMTINEPDGPERGVVFSWDGPAELAFEIPEGQGDVRDMDVVSLRACQGTRHPNTRAHDGPLGFAVALEDADGTQVEVPVDPFGLLTPVYARAGLGAGEGWANEFNTVRLPLSSFAALDPGLDLGAIRWVRLRFGPDQGAATGRLGLDDLAFGRR